MSGADEVAAALPGYDIGEQIGRGGWGVVLAGRHRRLQREVAIKQLPSAFASDPVVRSRFTAEARALAALDHPHVVPVFDFVEQDGLCLLVMEMLPGGTVWSRFTSEGFSGPSAVAVALSCASGLKAAHEKGILHRDVKPENLLFGANGAVKVTDFGIAKMIGGGETLATKAGDVLGTPSYMAPEQARGAALTPATDVYALSTMLYELLAGVLPFSYDGDVMSLLFRRAFDPPTQLRDVAPSVPAELAAVVMRGLATDPSDRYPTAESFGGALAAAGKSHWGEDWLLRQAVPVLGAETMTAPPVRAAQQTFQGSFTVPQPPGAPPGSAAPPAGDMPVPPDSGHTGPPLSPIVSTSVRPEVAEHPRGVALSEVAASDLVPVQRVVPRRPLLPALSAVVLALLVAGVAFVGIGNPARGGTLKANSILVNKVAVTGASAVPIDVTSTTTVVVDDAPPADQVQLSLQIMGIPAESASAKIVHRGSRATAALPALGNRYVLGGSVTGQLTLVRGSHSVGNWRFPVRTTQPGLATAVAVGDALLILLCVAYLESLLRSLRRCRSRVAGSIGIPVVGAALGIALVVAGWLVTKREPTTATLAVSVGLAVAAGVAAAVSALRVGRRRRYRRRNPVSSPMRSGGAARDAAGRR